MSKDSIITFNESKYTVTFTVECCYHCPMFAIQYYDDSECRCPVGSGIERFDAWRGDVHMEVHPECPLREFDGAYIKLDSSVTRTAKPNG